ncbi:MAG: flagellar hook protein FlgE [Candidatus Eremiobacteraeota bacterium]|nr:flagellar hook protein FlgE [Candidatus Eremiobacteraeota bacterium]
MAANELFTAVSGLNAYQQQLDTISNNIANVGTVGYKSQDITFQDLLYQTQIFASAPTTTNGGVNPAQQGLGVKVATIDTNFSQGGLQTTGINTDLAINGDGFFILKNVNGSGLPSYTRDGHFSINQNGVLYDPSSGLEVAGYQAAGNGTVTQTGNPGTIQIPLGLKAQAVGTGFGTKTGPTNDKNFDVQFGGNLDQTLYIQASQVGATPQSVTISTSLYDSLGNAHLVNITFTPATVGGGGSNGTIRNTLGVATSIGTEWAYTITKGNPADTAVFPASVGYVFYDQNGQFINTSSSIGGPFTAANTHTQGPVVSLPVSAVAYGPEGNLISINNWGTPANNSVPTAAANPAAIALDFSQMSSLAGTSTATTESQNGYGQGTLSNISIGQDGTVTGAFTNGQQQTLAQIALATFQNEEGLSRIGNSMFQATANSGLPQINTAGTGKLGFIVAGSLEESNVSLADEFVKMILAQRAFQANSKSITTADQDLQVVISLKQ